MTVNEYWRKRSLMLRETEYNMTVEFLNALDELYQSAIRDTEKELAVFYARLAANNDISISAARRYLTSAELPGFRMTLREYQRMASQIGLPEEYQRMLENASLKTRITRLEAIKLQMQQAATVLKKTELDALDYFLQKTYLHSFGNGAFTVFSGVGVTFDGIGVDIDTVAKLVRKPWAVDGSNFSQRIWGDHRPQLVNSLSTTLGKMLAKGESPDKAIEAISKKFNASRKSAVRLVQSEASFFAEQAKLDMYKELDVEEYEFASSLTESTCEECGDLDGKHWKITEKEPGVNFPPIHPNCTICTTVPYVDPAELENDTRVAKDANGKTVYIPANMKYAEWKKLYLKGGKTGDALPPPRVNSGFDKEIIDFWNKVGRIGSNDE